MKLFIWESVADATSNYHGEGGVLVVAETLERARASFVNEVPCRCEANVMPPDYIIECDAKAAPIVLIFPNAGCC